MVLQQWHTANEGVGGALFGVASTASGASGASGLSQSHASPGDMTWRRAGSCRKACDAGGTCRDSCTKHQTCRSLCRSILRLCHLCDLSCTVSTVRAPETHTVEVRASCGGYALRTSRNVVLATQVSPRLPVSQRPVSTATRTR